MNLNHLLILLLSIFLVGCREVEDAAIADVEAQEVAPVETTESSEKEEPVTPVGEEPEEKEAPAEPSNDLFAGYELIEVDGGGLFGYRQSNVAVNIGFGNRDYWAFTNEYGQLERVVADEIVLQDDDNEPVLASGRCYLDEAKVPGVESDVLDERIKP